MCMSVHNENFFKCACLYITRLDGSCAKDSTPEPLTKKRPRSSPTLITPHRELEKDSFQTEDAEREFPKATCSITVFCSP